MRLPALACLLLVSLSAFSQSTGKDKKLLWKQRAGGPIVGGACLGPAGKLYYGDTTGNLYSISPANSLQQLLVKLPAGIQSTPACSGDSLFVYGNNGVLYALNASTGKLLWQFNTDGEQQYDFWDYYRSSPQYVNGLLYFGSGDHHVYAIEASTGKQKWKFKTEGVVHADPAISSDTLFIGSYDGNMYALNAKSGELIWKFKTIGDRYFPKGEVQKAALVTDEAVIFGSRDFNIYAVSKQSGYGLWNRKEAGSWIIATPLLFKGDLFYGTSDSHAFYASSVMDGSTHWRIPIPFRSYGTPVVFGSSIFMGCFNGQLYELDAATGKARGQFRTVGNITNGSKIFDAKQHLRKDFKMYGTDAETRAAEIQIFNTGAILATPLLKDGVLYFGATDGYFYALSVR